MRIVRNPTTSLILGPPSRDANRALRRKRNRLKLQHAKIHKTKAGRIYVKNDYRVPGELLRDERYGGRFR